MSRATTLSPMMFGDAESATSGAARWLSPALIGLSAPLVIGFVMFPGLLDNARGQLVSLLLMLLLVCVGAYGLSVLNPGQVVSVLVDRRAREIELASAGLFASKVRVIAFDEIAELSVAKQYDDDGNAHDTAELRLTDGEIIALPQSMTTTDVAVARQAIGRAPTAGRRR